MKSISMNSMVLSLLAASSLAFAQDRPAPTGGWRRVTDPPPNQSANQSPNQDQNRPGDSQDRPPEPEYRVPPQLTIKPGTFITVRVNQMLSSDRNQVDDAFSASLERPIVIDGVVVAQRGQTLGGRVAEVRKAGRVEGVSRLGLQLTDLSLVDGQQVPIQSQLVTRNGSTSVGRDAGAIAGTTAAGAAIGAGVNGGVGAGVGAAAGVVVGAIGVLLTRGHATVIYPEAVMTFRIEAPVTISTERGSHAFRYVDPNEYDRPYDSDARMQRRPDCGPYGCPPPPRRYYGYSPYYYPYGYGFGGFYGPSFYFGSGFGHGYGHGFHGGGHRR